MSHAWADMTKDPSGGWRTTLYRPLYTGASMYLPTKGPVTPGAHGFEGPAEWLREQGYDVTAWGVGANGGFRAELKRL